MAPNASVAGEWKRVAMKVVHSGPVSTGHDAREVTSQGHEESSGKHHRAFYAGALAKNLQPLPCFYSNIQLENIIPVYSTIT